MYRKKKKNLPSKNHNSDCTIRCVISAIFPMILVNYLQNFCCLSRYCRKKHSQLFEHTRAMNNIVLIVVNKVAQAYVMSSNFEKIPWMKRIFFLFDIDQPPFFVSVISITTLKLLKWIIHCLRFHSSRQTIDEYNQIRPLTIVKVIYTYVFQK